MRQAMSGSKVFIQVPLVWLSECLLPVHHPLGKKEKEGRHDEANQSNHHKRKVKKKLEETV